MKTDVKFEESNQSFGMSMNGAVFVNDRPDALRENFVAIYRETKWEEILEAANLGKHIYAKHGENVYVLISITSSRVLFSRAQQTSIDYVIVNLNDQWSSSSIKISDAGNIKFKDGENLQEKYDNGKLGGPQGGSSVNADWSQNDPSSADYVKNRTHWKETFPSIEWDGSTEGRDSFDASSIGFGVLYKVSDDVWTQEQAKLAKICVKNLNNGEETVSGNFNSILLEDDAIGFAADYAEGIFVVIAFFAKQAVDLTEIYGFSIPSAGCYFYFPNGAAWGENSIGIKIPPVFHKLEREFLPDGLVTETKVETMIANALGVVENGTY